MTPMTHPMHSIRPPAAPAPPPRTLSVSVELRSRATALRETCLAFPNSFLVPLFFNMSALCLLYMRLEQRSD
jgi:hypothetical protein